MSVSLQKGQKVSLTKDNAGLGTVVVGLGWDEAKKSGGLLGGLFGGGQQAIDCDASALMLRSGKLVDKMDVVFFGNLTHPSGTVRHMGDNLTGAGDGDDEQIVIDLAHVPAEYDLTENYNGMTAMIFGEVYRHNGEWKFNAIGQATTDPGLGELLGRYV